MHLRFIVNITVGKVWMYMFVCVISVKPMS